MRTFKYPVVIFTIIVILLVVIGVGLAILFAQQASREDTSTAPPTIATRSIANGFTRPTDIASTAGDERLYVVEQAGKIQRITPGQKDIQTFMDITPKVLNGGERGLLGLAFHPDYAENGYIFVDYIDKNGNTIVARYHVTNDAVDNTSEKIILQVEQPYSNHKGGDLVFDQSGYLYIALGDGGQAGDPHDNAQNKNSLLGKILRVDINTDQAYAIPSSNPFVDEEGARPEIWAYGLRNPWRMSFDSQTYDLYIADVGQGEIEEINFQPASSGGGENYGWRCYEGTQEYNLENCTGVNNLTKPIVEYSHEEGRCSVTGGYVYRGQAYPTLQGKYFYGDFCGSQLYYTEQKDGVWEQTLALDTHAAISAFGVDSNNELYFADYDGGVIYQIEAK